MKPIPQIGDPGRTCSTCVYFTPDGECIAGPPTVLLFPDGERTCWPRPKPHRACGEWSPPRTQVQPNEAARVEAVTLRRDLLSGQGRVDGLHAPLPGAAG